MNYVFLGEPDTYISKLEIYRNTKKKEPISNGKLEIKSHNDHFQATHLTGQVRYCFGPVERSR